MANISEKVEQIRKAIYGKDVRESIASGIEAINDHVETTVAAEETREANEAERIANYSAIITEYENFNGEVEQAKESLAKEKEFETLGARLEESEQDLANHETAADPHDQYALDADLTTLQTEVTSHKAEDVTQGVNPHGIIYEEGIWTPALISPNITYTEQYGKYIRHNNLLWLLGCITVDEITEENTNLVLSITGFPFVHSINNNDRAIMNLTRNTLISYESGYNKITIVGNSGTNMFFDDTTNVKTRIQIKIRNLIAGGSLAFWVVYKMGG